MSRPNQPNDAADPSNQSIGSSSRHRGGKRATFAKSAGGIAVIALVGLYAFARPMINERMGWDLPELRHGADGQIQVVDSKPAAKASVPTKSNTNESQQSEKSFSPIQKSVAATRDAESKNASSSSKPAETKPGTTSIAKGPLADRMRPSETSTSAKNGKSSGAGDLLHGLLRDLGSRRYISPAGLLYTPGSAEGHRLEHLRRHTEDQPNRPGSHGVFDGGMEGALETIDRAYDHAKKGQRTTKKTDDGRTIYTVDMGGRVGFVGGSDGGRRRNPMARRVRLILEGTRVITAYPM